MKRLLSILVALGLSSGCVYFAHLHAPDWWPNKDIAPFAKDASAIFLRIDETYSMKAFKTQVYTEHLVHGKLKVLTEAGLDAANIKLLSRPGADLNEFSARVIQPDGQTIEVDPERVLEEDLVIDGEPFRRTVMRVPQVKVGSTIEYYYLFYYDGYMSLIRQFLSRDIPVQEYNLDFTMGRNVVFEVRQYNTQEGIKLERDGKGFHFTLHAENIPKRQREAFGPDGTLSEPWWVMSTKQVGDYWVNENWDTAMRSYAENLYLDHADKYFDDFEPDIKPAGCGPQDVLCKVRLALDYVHNTMTYKGNEDWWEAKHLPEAVKKGQGSNQDKNYLLFAALKSLGVEARLGAVNRYLTRGYDLSMPASLWFNHTIVFVEPQPGFDRRLAVDASCEYCDIGQMPWWSRGVKAMWVEPYQNVTGRVAAKTKFYTLASRPMKGGLDRTVMDVDLAPDGKAKVSLGRRWEGPSARSKILKTITDDLTTRQRSATNAAKKRFPSATRTGYQDALTCDRRTAQCTETLFAEGEALGVLSLNKLIVPLSVMRSSYDGTFATDERQYDIFVQYPRTIAETVRVKIPAGYRVAEKPTPVSEDAEAFAYTLKVRDVPDGIEITRRLDVRRGRYSRNNYAKLRAPVRSFEKAKTLAVVLEKVGDGAVPARATPAPPTEPGSVDAVSVDPAATAP